MTTFEIPASELAAFDRDLKFYEIKKRQEIERLTEKTTDDIWRDARAGAPVAEGDLRDSIKKKLIETAREVYGEVIVHAFYGHMVEFGTVKMPADPYVGPAYERHRAKFIAGLAKILRS